MQQSLRESQKYPSGWNVWLESELLFSHLSCSMSTEAHKLKFPFPDASLRSSPTSCKPAVCGSQEISPEGACCFSIKASKSISEDIFRSVSLSFSPNSEKHGEIYGPGSSFITVHPDTHQLDSSPGRQAYHKIFLVSETLSVLTHRDEGLFEFLTL